MRIKMTDLRRLIREAILSDDERVAAEKKKDDAKRVAGSILDSFELGGQKDDEVTEKAIEALKSNLANLDITDMSDIENLRDPNKRTAAIKKIRGMLPST